MEDFVIVSPYQYGGGPIVLHLLCKLLRDKGYNAKIYHLETIPSIKYKGRRKPCSLANYGSTVKYFGVYFIKMIREILMMIAVKCGGGRMPVLSKYLYETVKGCKTKFLPFVDKNTIVVYPEICYGNVLNAQKVVRWLLYHNMFEDDEKAFGKDDLVVCYREVFNDPKLNPDVRTLHIYNFDFDLYKQTNFGERSGKCYIIRKGASRGDLPEKFDGPILDKLSERNIAKAFNKYKYCYFYDTQTFYAGIAAICGCIPIVVCEPGKRREDYILNATSYGIAYGDSDDEIQYAISTRELLFEKIKRETRDNVKKVDDFIELCNNYFHKNE